MLICVVFLFAWGRLRLIVLQLTLIDLNLVKSLIDNSIYCN